MAFAAIMESLIQEAKKDILKRHPEKANELDAFLSFLDAYADERYAQWPLITQFHSYQFLEAGKERTWDRSLTDVKARHTLYLCTILRLCRPETLRMPRRLCVLFNMVRVHLSQAVLWLNSPLSDMFNMDIVSTWFPGASEAWFRIIFDYMVNHIDDIAQALSSLQQAANLESCPKEIFSPWGTFQLHSVPSGWTLNNHTALLSLAFSPYFAYDKARAQIQAWLDRVSPGCASGYGWDFVIHLARSNLDSVRSGFRCNWIRGLWTRFIFAFNDSRSKDIICAVRFHQPSPDNNAYTAICSVADASSVVASIYFPEGNVAQMDLKLNGASRTAHPVLDFKLNSSTCGHEYFYSFGIFKTAEESTDRLFSQPGYMEKVLPGVSKWVKKMADAERSLDGPTSVYYDDVFEIFVVCRDERTRLILRQHIYRHYQKFRLGHIKLDADALSEINSTFESIMNRPPKPIRESQGTLVGTEAMAPFITLERSRFEVLILHNYSYMFQWI